MATEADLKRKVFGKHGDSTRLYKDQFKNTDQEKVDAILAIMRHAQKPSEIAQIKAILGLKDD